MGGVEYDAWAKDGGDVEVLFVPDGEALGYPGLSGWVSVQRGTPCEPYFLPGQKAYLHDPPLWYFEMKLGTCAFADAPTMPPDAEELVHRAAQVGSPPETPNRPNAR